LTSDRKIFRQLQTLEQANSILSRVWQPKPLPSEVVPIEHALGRALAEDVVSAVDVPGFDRAAMDGFAVRAEDLYNADEQHPAVLRVVGEIEAGNPAAHRIAAGESVEIATGAPIPSGANAVAMVEFTKRTQDRVSIFKAVTIAENITGAGSDIMCGELLLRQSQLITPREIGLLAAAGVKQIPAYRKPRVAIFSSGNELINPGERLEFAKLFDVNGPTLIAAVAECGGEPIFHGILPDNYSAIKNGLKSALENAVIVMTSGSTSSGPGDLIYRAIEELGEPGILVHGLNLKPGKPVVVALANDKPIFGLPGYPTSALMIFHVLVAPIIRQLAHVTEGNVRKIQATSPLKFFKARGRRELLPVQLIAQPDGKFSAYPMQSGSGAISSFSLADGFADLPDSQEFVDEGEELGIELFGMSLIPPSLVAIGSHCLGLDVAFKMLRERDPHFSGRTINVGSVGGFYAIKHGEADIAGVHLFDKSGEYNVPFISVYGLQQLVVLIRGYNREQGLIVPRGNPKNIKTFSDLLRKGIVFINRNRGSGTRLLIDKYLAGLARSLNKDPGELERRIEGFTHEAKSHSAVAAAIRNGRADVGYGIRSVATVEGLDFIKTDDEKYDFLIAKTHVSKPSVVRFVELLRSKEFAERLRKDASGLTTAEDTGEIIFPSKAATVRAIQT
jgi:putative molybdopterin biosynthesis protein